MSKYADQVDVRGDGRVGIAPAWVWFMVALGLGLYAAYLFFIDKRNLYGVLGRDIASRNGFRYSSALSDKGGEWDFAKLDRWLARPNAFAPGTKMSFAGISNAQARADLIVYLNLQGSLIPLPEGPSE